MENKLDNITAFIAKQFNRFTYKNFFEEWLEEVDIQSGKKQIDLPFDDFELYEFWCEGFTPKEVVNLYILTAKP